MSSALVNTAIAVTNALGQAVLTAYDLQARITNVWGTATYPVAYTFDQYGRMTGMRTWRDPAQAGALTQWIHDEGIGHHWMAGYGHVAIR